MPNHVMNRIYGDREVLETLLNGEGHVDFTLVIPEPPNIEPGPCSGVHEPDEVCWYLWNIKNWGTKWNAYDTVYDPQVLDEEAPSSEEVLSQLFKLTWNEPELLKTLSMLQFSTAWSHPVPVIKALSEAHPLALLYVQYADEDLGSNCGTYFIRGGQYAEVYEYTGTDEGLELAAWLQYGQTYAELKAVWDADEAAWAAEQEKKKDAGTLLA